MHAGTQKSPIGSSFGLGMRFLGVPVTDRLYSSGISDIREEDLVGVDFIRSKGCKLCRSDHYRFLGTAALVETNHYFHGR